VSLSDGPLFFALRHTHESARARDTRRRRAGRWQSARNLGTLDRCGAAVDFGPSRRHVIV